MQKRIAQIKPLGQHSRRAYNQVKTEVILDDLANRTRLFLQPFVELSLCDHIYMYQK